MKRYIKASKFSPITEESIKRALKFLDAYELVEMYESLTGDYVTDDYDENEDIEIIADDLPLDILADVILKLKNSEHLESTDAYDLVNEVKFYI